MSPDDHDTESTNADYAHAIKGHIERWRHAGYELESEQKYHDGMKRWLDAPVLLIRPADVGADPRDDLFKARTGILHVPHALPAAYRDRLPIAQSPAHLTDEPWGRALSCTLTMVMRPVIAGWLAQWQEAIDTRRSTYDDRDLKSEIDALKLVAAEDQT